ncbi:unnamed protein product [Ectocarpus sp. CCAP 1310/34]|nr:unnamed protein product [Ectocarpus sp. CCAP 1310/34]
MTVRAKTAVPATKIRASTMPVKEIPTECVFSSFLPDGYPTGGIFRRDFSFAHSGQLMLS